MPFHNRQQTRKLNRQVSFIIAAGLTIITVIATLLIWKEREVESRVYLIDKIGIAVEDFRTGVMHISLSREDATSPWNYNTGVALIQQALEEFREANAVISSELASETLTASSEVFEQQLQSYSITHVQDELRLRQASYTLNINIRNIEKTLRKELEQERMTQRLWFSLTMLISIAMLVPLVVSLLRSEYKRLGLDYQLRQSEQKFLELAEKIDEVFWLEDLIEDKVLYLSPAFSKIYGIPTEDVYKNKYLWRESLHPDDKPQVVEALSNLKRTPLSLEYRIIRNDGEVRWISDRTFPIYDEPGEDRPSKLATIAADITDRKRRDNEMFHSQKLEAIGQLTGGVSHDFNNLLTVILNNAELLSWKHATDEESLHFSKMIVKAAQRGASLNQQLLAFASKQQLRPQELDIIDLVKETRDLLSRSVSGQIQLTLKLPERSSVTASVDPAQLQTALLNLCINSRDAMPSGGEITITVSVDNSRKKVFIDVSDTGHGIPAAELKKVIEPFYTTKERGKGTGLGLSMVYGFVQQSGGQLHIDSRELIGTTVTIELPLVGSQSTSSLPSKDGAFSEYHSTAGDGFHVLIVEDEEFLLETSSRTLDRHGYHVIKASSGPEALEILETDLAIDLLFTDVLMPGGINGLELAEKARALRPQLKVVLTSGYNELAMVDNDSLLKKPYSTREMLEKISDAL